MSNLIALQLNPLINHNAQHLEHEDLKEQIKMNTLLKLNLRKLRKQKVKSISFDRYFILRY